MDAGGTAPYFLLFLTDIPLKSLGKALGFTYTRRPSIKAPLHHPSSLQNDIEDIRYKYLTCY